MFNSVSISVPDDDSDELAGKMRVRVRRKPKKFRFRGRDDFLRRMFRKLLKWWMLLLFLPAIGLLIFGGLKNAGKPNEESKSEIDARKILEGNLNRLDPETRVVKGIRERCLKLLPPQLLQHLDIPASKESNSPVKKLVYKSDDSSYEGVNTTPLQKQTEATRFNLFTGYQTLHQREQSFKVNETTVVHCGFYSENGGYKVSIEDKNYMQTCKVVVSTCAFGGGDDLYQPINMSEASLRKVCYVAFWDDITLKTQEVGGKRIDENHMIGKWRIVVIKDLPFVDQRLNGKIPKMLSHRLFPQARYSIWVDSKSQFRRDPLGVLEALLWRTNSTLAISEHGARSSVYDEGKAVIKKHKATPEEVEGQLSQYRRDGFPDDKRYNGKKALSEASVIVREHTPLTNLFMCLWFNEVVLLFYQILFSPNDHLSVVRDYCGRYQPDSFEATYGTRMLEVELHDSSLNPSKCMEVASRYKRSKSYPDKRLEEEQRRLKLGMGQGKGHAEPKENHSPMLGVQSSLKQEILQLEKRLQDQFVVRHGLEKALGYRSSFHDISNENSMPKPAKELIKEIAVLELEVLYLEQYLLSLYRKSFDQQISDLSPSTMSERVESSLFTQKDMFLKVSGLAISSERENSAVQSARLPLRRDLIANPRKDFIDIPRAKNLLDFGIHRSHSLLSQHSAYLTRTSPPMETLDRALRACHSQPLSFLKHGRNATSNVISLAEHLGTRIADHVPETANRLSEDMITCMSAIYCKLAEPSLMHNGISSSPISSLSSVNAFSPRDQYDLWIPRCRKDPSFDAQLDNPFHVEGLKEFSGPYSTMVEVPWICRDNQKLSDSEDMLQNFRSLVCRLEEVDPRKMTHVEKLAFWVNVHNALVMHAFLAYGIPQNNMKRVSLLLKAAYNVGGRTISADTIQSSILGCRIPRPGQWFRLFFPTKKKFKAGNDRKAYAIERPEPLLHFALCSGSHSDPAVRVYTPKRLLQELEAAKEEYIRATYGVRKVQKILLPKIVEYYAKDTGLCPAGVVEMIQQCIPESLRKTTMHKSLNGKTYKSIEWVPHNFAFRYLISKELVE
ncbi:hypothetical protein NE237_017879 [Protea cynaroides]|uniref:DUF547 domain-containing protein n=1 Tax=Protea cynaroides TaxID=273540 RepID=A0A9Q0QNG0_9MAGN|nr:hypothetical protein NE237_017879 [Protea cynaroides]